MVRTSLPKKLERDILIESGHRCAIPTCRQTPVEIAHIKPWAQAKEHTFDNLIALCPTCHTRYDKGEIDKISIIRYKKNLSLINQRYGDFEKRILFLFSQDISNHEVWIPGGLDILVMFLVKDGYLVKTVQNSGVIMNGIASAYLYKLTQSGREFVKQWVTAEEII